MSYTCLIYHIVFGTRRRESCIEAGKASRLHAYISTIASDLGGKRILVNGSPDHLHMILHLKPTHDVATIVPEGESELVAMVPADV